MVVRLEAELDRPVVTAVRVFDRMAARLADGRQGALSVIGRQAHVGEPRP